MGGGGRTVTDTERASAWLARVEDWMRLSDAIRFQGQEVTTLLAEFAAVRAEAREVALREAAEECEVQARSFGRRPPTLYGESCQLTARSCASAILGLIRRSQ